jgi:microcystin-dependent protein
MDSAVPGRNTMAEPFLGEIRIVAFNFPPKGWALCNGQLLPINQNQALFSILGTTYGGDGRVNFALPNFQGRAPIHVGQGVTLGERGGAEAVTLLSQNLPQHDHGLLASAAPASAASAAGSVLAKKAKYGKDVFAAPANLVAMSGGALAATGGSQPHTNLQPYLTLSFVIALQGIFPSQN